MRKIKFRAWDISEKCWIDIKSMGFEGSRKSNELWYVQACDENERDIDPPYFPEMGDIELLQFTGLHDKNGREIYEGDVLYHPVQGYRRVFYPYSDRVAAFGLREIYNGMGSTLDNPFLYEIIGNIHEHPNLLEQADE